MSAEDSDEPLTIVQPYGAQASTCGYCGAEPGVRSAARSSHTFGVEAIQLSCSTYQKMIDRGWRRSGTYCYKPNLATSCCPQYTIRLDVQEFTPSRSQRKVIHRFNRFVSGDREGEGKDGGEVTGPSASTSNGKKAVKKLVPTPNPKKEKEKDGGFSLIEELHSTEAGTRSSDVNLAHEYDVILEPARFTPEKFELYCRYQAAVHNDHDKRPDGFSRFLCDSPLQNQKIPYSKPPPPYLPTEYGSYHQMYRLDGELIAMGVVDVLPHCVSSVYLIYLPKMEEHSLGKLSALKEIALVQEMAQYGAPGGFLYMGFYIHSCAKMKYKAQYSPSYLLEPTNYTWHSFETCGPLLDRFHYVPFAHPARARRPVAGVGDGSTVLDDAANQEDAFDEDASIRESVVGAVMIGKIKRGTVHTTPASRSAFWKNEHSREEIRETATLLGQELATTVILVMS